MLDLDRFLDCLKENKVGLITGVPDTLLNDFCLSLDSGWPKEQQVIAANEGNAIGLAAGNYIASGKVPLVYMQNSGLGNATNPLLSLTNRDVYGIPLVMLIGWRGDPSINDHPQHQLQGKLSPVFLEQMQIPLEVLEGDSDENYEKVKRMVQTARENNAPTALLVRKGVLEKGEKAGFPQGGSNLLSREEAINHILDELPKDSLFVATTGRATRELHELRNLRNEEHCFDFLNVGAMGHASSIALGIAMAQPHRQVVCLDGDGSTLMHLGALPINASLKLKNLLHVVLNNGAHESVGGQSTVAHQTDFTEIARASGYRTVSKYLSSKEEISKTLQTFQQSPSCSFIDIHIRKGMRTDLPPLKMHPPELKGKFMSEVS